MLAIASPVWTRLSVHAAAGVGVAMRHIWVWPVRRVLPIRVGWARRRDGRIYRYIVVRFYRMGMMVSPIRLGHRRTVWLLLRHTSAAGAAGWMVWTLQVLCERS